MADSRALLPITSDQSRSSRNNGVSSFVKGGLGLMVTACFDLLVAFSTNYWATWNNKEKQEHGGYGLWKLWHCFWMTQSDGEVTQKRLLCEEKWTDTTFPAWYVATEVLMTLGLAGLLASLIMLLIYVFAPKCSKNKPMMDALIATSYVSGLFIMVALCVFGFKVVEGITESSAEWFLSWSFSLACTAFVLNAISASILITESKRLTQKAAEARKQQQEQQPQGRPHIVLTSKT